jgi:hypothetical protein
MSRIRLRPETVASLQPSCLDDSDSPAEQDDACAFDAKRDRKVRGFGCNTMSAKCKVSYSGICQYEDLMISNRSLLSINRQHEGEVPHFVISSICVAEI